MAAARQNPEAEFESEILAWAKKFGWWRHGERPAYDANRKYRTAIKGEAGWPDLTLAHEKAGIIIFREAKIPPRTLSPAQVICHRVLLACGCDVKVWTPNDWPEIMNTLTFGRVIHPHDSQTWRRRL